MNRPDNHPTWCGRNHLCTHQYGGEHRSYPITIDTHRTRLVITRIRTHAGSDRIEIRTVIDLPTDPELGRRYAMTILGRLHKAITATRSWP